MRIETGAQNAITNTLVGEQPDFDLTATARPGRNWRKLLLRGTAGLLSPQQMLQKLDRGLYVTEMMGQGVNGVTGDYSRGASGFWVEGGEIAYPVHEVTIAGNLRPMYQQVLALGDDVDTHGAIRTGSALVDGLTIAGS